MVMAHSFMVFLLLLWQYITLIHHPHQDGCIISPQVLRHLWVVSIILVIGLIKGQEHLIVAICPDLDGEHRLPHHLRTMIKAGQ